MLFVLFYIIFITNLGGLCMRVVVQRVKHASVTINGTVNGKINNGFLVLLGILVLVLAVFKLSQINFSCNQVADNANNCGKRTAQKPVYFNVVTAYI